MSDKNANQQNPGQQKEGGQQAPSQQPDQARSQPGQTPGMPAKGPEGDDRANNAPDRASQKDQAGGMNKDQKREDRDTAGGIGK